MERAGHPTRRFALVRSVVEQPHALLRAALHDQGWRQGEAVTAISDGDPALPALVRSATGGSVELILDWFHLSMRVHHVEQVMGGLCALEPPPSAPPDQAQIDVERLRHLLWNGHHDKACEALGRIVSWAKDASVLDDPATGAGAKRLVARCTALQVLHATPVAMAPVHTAFQALWPEAELVNLLNDGLTTDRAREDDLSPAMIDRFVSLCRYGQSVAADGLLVTCSAFGPAIERAADELAIPVLKPNEAMFQAAIRTGNKIGMIATFAPSLSTMEEEFREEAQRMGSTAELTSVVVPEAMAALRKEDAATHNRLVSERGQQLSGFDAVMLAHFSTSQAAPALRAVTGTPVLTAPESAVARMRQLVPGRTTAV